LGDRTIIVVDCVSIACVGYLEAEATKANKLNKMGEEAI
jgi:hypothetical protein